MKRLRYWKKKVSRLFYTFDAHMCLLTSSVMFNIYFLSDNILKLNTVHFIYYLKSISDVVSIKLKTPINFIKYNPLNPYL